jgi:hypothetical protein
MARKVIGPTGSRRRRWLFLCTTFAAIAAAVIFIPGALAWSSATSGVQDTGFFQLDGNTLPGTCTTASTNDWAGLFNAGGSQPCGSAGFSFVQDGVGSADKTYWKGGGSKDSNDPGGGPWQWGANDVSPDKNDLDNAFAALYNVPDTNPANTTGTEPILFFGSDRFDVSGDAQQGFEFLQANSCLAGGAPGSLPGGAACPGTTPTTSPATCDTNAGKSNTGWFVDPATGCPVHHKDGDLLVLVDFNNGGGLGGAGVFEWGPKSGTAHPGVDDPTGVYTQVVFGNTANCTTIGDPNAFCSTTNTTPLAEPVWPYTTKGTTGQATYKTSSFVEGGLNLASIAGAGTCFPSFLAESRSSAGPGTGIGLTAQLKDLAFGKFELCGASISIGPSAVNEVNHQHTFTVQVNGTKSGVSGPISGVNPTVTLTGSSGISGSYTGTGTLPGDFGDIHVVSDSCRTSGTDSSGQCTVVFTSSKAGIVTGHATASVVLNGTTFNVATDGNSPNSGDAVKRFVDANIGLSPLTATNEVNHSHTVTVTVHQNDGLAANTGGGDATTGYGPPPVGTQVTVTLTNGTGAAYSITSQTCSGVGKGTDANGQCTVTFSSPSAGTVTIHATTTFSVGGVSLTRATGDGKTGDSADASKVFVDGKIGIGPPLANNLINQPHTFTVTVQQDDGLIAGAPGDNATGFGPPPVGTLVNVTLTGTGGNLSGLLYTGLGAGQSPTPPGDYGTAPNAIHVTSDSCRTAGTDANGQCTIVFTSAVTGQVTGHAAVDLTFGLVAVHRETDGIAPNSGDAVKNFVAGSIKWFKVDNAGNPLGGATFTECKTKNYNFTTQALDSITPVCNDVLDNTGQQGYSGLDTNNTAGTFQLTGLSLGEYTVTEKTAPAGFVADSTVQTVDLLPASPDQTISTRFVNHRPILKISGFGYTNIANGTPTHGVTNGTVTYTVNLHNYGDAAATLSNSSLAVSTDSVSGAVNCTLGNTQSITGTIAAGGDSTPFTMTCTYNVSTGDHVTALLTVKYTTNGLERNASGSPATIQYTVEGD